MSHAHLNLASPIESQLPQITCFADNKNSQYLSTNCQIFLCFLFSSFVWRNTSYQGLCLEEHIIPEEGTACQSVTGRWLQSPERALVLPQSLKARVCEESLGSCSLRQAMSVHSWGEFDLMRICSTVLHGIQACR